MHAWWRARKTRSVGVVGSSGGGRKKKGGKKEKKKRRSCTRSSPAIPGVPTGFLLLFRTCNLVK